MYLNLEPKIIFYYILLNIGVFNAIYWVLIACCSLNICINGVYAVLVCKSHIFKPIQLPLQNITCSFSASYIA